MKGSLQRSVLSSLVILFAATGCDRAVDDTAADAAVPAAATEASAELETVRRATEPFQDLAAAQAAGWSMLVPRCRDNPPTGGMGWHWANPSLIDDVVEVERPEALVYEPQADGSQKLVAVEYVIPYDARGADQEPPTLLGQQFLHNDNDQLWMLHVWVWENNPEGMFATWNPNVSCAHAQHES